MEPIKISTRKYGELDHTELVHLLDSLEGDQAKSRFRESIYVSIIFYLLLALLLIYGPKYIFHTGTIVPTAASIKERQRLQELELSRNLEKTPPKPPKPLPKVDRKVLEQLQAMQRASEAAKAAQAPPTPAPEPAPTPPPPPVVAQNLPPTPMPQPSVRPPPSALPDAPRSNLPPAPSAGQSIAEAAKNPAPGRLGGGHAATAGGGHVGQQTAGTGVDILSDTGNWDFRDYIKRLLRMVYTAWLPLIPEECSPPLNKEGTTLIRFVIERNGQLGGMWLDDSTHDRAIDHAAWGAITGVGQFQPLPPEYKGQNLELRIQFEISRNARPNDF
jgi:outer membrane biosynthesis protein TonB